MFLNSVFCILYDDENEFDIAGIGFFKIKL